MIRCRYISQGRTSYSEVRTKSDLGLILQTTAGHLRNTESRLQIMFYWHVLGEGVLLHYWALCNDTSFGFGKGYLHTGLEVIEYKSQGHWRINDMINRYFAKGRFGEAHMSQIPSLVWLSGGQSHKIGLLRRFPVCLGLDSGAPPDRFSFFCGVDFLPSLWEPSNKRIMQTKQRQKRKQEGNLTNDLKPPLGSGSIFMALAGEAFWPTPTY